jgi:NADPH:quinone reductase-like Zn-dependent oxidoreductase
VDGRKGHWNCSTRNFELVRGIGAERVIDYNREDFTASGERYDVIFDLVGNRPLADFRRVLNPRGAFIACGGGGPETSAGHLLAGMVRQLVLGWFTSQRLVGILAQRKKEDLEFLSKLMAGGDVTPVIDHCYPLSEVPQAIRYVEAGHARGKVVIAIA